MPKLSRKLLLFPVVSNSSFPVLSLGELKPATAFMTGQLKLSGDLAKAMALESVMKAARGIKDYHTWARR